MAYKISIDADKCIGCGSCEATCPDCFKLGDDSKAHPVKDQVEEIGCCQGAADICPVQCIEVKEI